MLEVQQREGLFSLLRQALKARGMTYAQVAEGLGVSELSVKRLFRDKDCKMSRLLEICELLQIRLDDLLAMQARARHQPEYLSEALESALAADLNLFKLFILLVSQVNLEDIRSLLQMDESQFYLLMRQLEKLGLIELINEKHFRFKVPLPIRWRLQGPLASALKKVNLAFVSHCFDAENEANYQFITMSRLVTQASAEELQQQFQTIRERFDYLATQDQMFYASDQLTLYKLVLGSGPFPIQEIVSPDNGNL